MSAYVNAVNIFKKALVSLSTISLVGLLACSGGGGGGVADVTDVGTPAATSQTLNGGAVDGPVTNADVAVYVMDFGATITVGSTATDTGTTNGNAKITGLSLPFPLNPPYILEFTANANTLDLSTCTDPANPSAATCFAPIISTMKTVITSEMLASGQNIYATPLTTMATNIALSNVTDADSDGTVSSTEFLTALNQAALQVTSMLGFGLTSDVDIFNTPPLIDEAADTTDEQQDTADYRAAITAVASIVHEMDNQATQDGADAATIFEELTTDMADGVIDGTVNGAPSVIFSDTTLDVLEQDPSTLPIPNVLDSNGDPVTIADIEQVLADETTATGSTTDTTSLTDGSVISEPAPAEVTPDIDADGKLNAEDAYPSNPLMDADTDGDGIPDVIYNSAGVGVDTNGDGFDDRAIPSAVNTGAISDNDDDNDNWTDAADDYPLDATRNLNPALDRDGDGVINSADNCVFNANTAQTDTDNNGEGDACSNDADGDGVTNDGTDNCPLVANPAQTDTGGTADGDACDTDIDGDTVLNADDAFPLDPAESVDTDKDGLGNTTADDDDDNDGVADVDETAGCELKADCDGDGYFDNVDLNDTDATITINFAPVANNVAVSTNEDTQVSASLSATDANTSDTLIYSVVASSAVNGTASITGSTFTFDPTADFSGTASFKYIATDNATPTANSNIATVTITVNAVNDAPVATAGTLTTNEDTAGTGTVAGSDTDGDSLTFAAGTTTPAKGGVVINANGSYIYTPNGNATGSDTFGFVANDGTVNSTEALITVTITAINDAPVATAGTLTTAEDTPTTGTVAGTDTEGTSLTYTASAASNGTVTITDAAAGTYSYAPNTNFNGSDSFSFVANDGTVDSALATVTITVTAINDAPVATAGTLTTNEDTAGTGTVAGTDVDTGDSLTFAAGTTTPTKGGVVINANGSYTYTPTLNATGSDTFGFIASDGTANSAAEALITVTITAINDVPVATAGTLSATEDTTATGTVAGTDTEGSSLTFAVATNASNGVVTITDSATGAYNYVPTANTNGPDSFTFTANDGTVDSTPATVTITVTAVNDAPAALNDTAGVQPSNSVVINVLGNDTDNDTGDTKTVVAVSAVTGTAGGTVAITNAGADVTYTASTGEGTATFTYTMQDAATVQSTATVTVTVTANPSPVASAGTLTVDEDSSNNTGTVSATDADPVTYSIATGASSGSASITNVDTGAYTYTPNPNFSGSDSFTFIANDGISDSAPATVTVTVTAANDAPTATTGTLTATEDTTATGTVAGSDIDTGDSLTFAVAANAANGTVTITDANTGAYSYVPAANFNGSDSFTFTANDGTVDSAPATVTITVSASNDLPVATAGTLTTNQNITATGTVVGSDVDGDSLTYTASTASNGTVTITDANTGAYSYVPTTDFSGSDSFTFVANDGTVDSAPATVTITVTADPIDAAGVWNTTSTVTAAVPESGQSCDQTVGDIDNLVVTITQDGAGNMTMKTVSGDTLTGTIDTATGAISLTGTTNSTGPDLAQPTVVATVSFSDAFTFTGTGAANGTMTGTLTAADSFEGVLQCTATIDISGSFVYKHTGSENYSGVYALELAGSEYGSHATNGPYSNSYKEGLPVEFEFDATAGTVKFYIPEEGGTETVSNTAFDPTTGFFSFDLNGQEFETDTNGTIIWSENRVDTISGIVMQDPATTNGTNGAPLLALAIYGYSYDYNGDFTTVGVLPYEVQEEDTQGYAKKLDTVGHTRTSLITKSDGTTETRILVGLLNAPLKNAGGDLYLQVMSGATELCHVPYVTGVEAGIDGRYFEQTNQPAPDFAALAFRGDTYSSLNCDTTDQIGPTEQVAFNDALTVNIIDAGADRLIDGVNDTTVYTANITATPVASAADRFTTVIDRFDLNVNGAKASLTQSGKLIDLPGYFNFNKVLPVSWPNHPEAAGRYQLRIQQPGDFIKNRFNVSNLLFVDIPANTMETYNAQALRLASIKDDAAGAVAMSFSRQVKIGHGIKGTFNFEMGNGVPVTHQSFPIYIEAGEFGGGCGTAPTLPFTCESSTVDFVNDAVTLNMTDTDGSLTGTAATPFQLVMHFSNSARAEITSPTITGIPTTPQGATATTAARVAKSGIVMRTLHLSHNGQERTQLNVTTPNPVFYDNVFIKRDDDGSITHTAGTVDTGSAAFPIWNSTDGSGTRDFFTAAVGGIYTQLPNADGVASGVISIASAHTNNWLGANVTLDAGRYKVIMQDSNGVYPQLVHHIDYPALTTAVDYAAPDGATVTLNGAAASNDATVGTDLTATGFQSVAWPSAYPIDARFRIIMTHPLGYELRTGWLEDGVGGLSIVTGTATWTPTAGFQTPVDGSIWKLKLRVGNNASSASNGATIVGASTGSGTNDDNVYFTNP